MKLERKSSIWQQFGRKHNSPPPSFFHWDPRLMRSTPTEISTGKWNDNLRPNFLIEASSHWHEPALGEKRSFWWKVLLEHIVERITVCINTRSDIHNIPSEIIRGEKSALLLDFAGRYVKNDFSLCLYLRIHVCVAFLLGGGGLDWNTGSTGRSSPVSSLSRQTPNALAGFCYLSVFRLNVWP